METLVGCTGIASSSSSVSALLPIGPTQITVLTPTVDEAPPELALAVTLPVPGLGMAPDSDGALIWD